MHRPRWNAAWSTASCPLTIWEEATRKYAERLALIDPEALTGTKLALRRGLEAGGFLTAMRAGVDVLASMYAATTESGEKFEAITEKEGLRAALEWRNAQFKEG